MAGAHANHARSRALALAADHVRKALGEFLALRAERLRQEMADIQERGRNLFRLADSVRSFTFSVSVTENPSAADLQNFIRQR